MGDHARRRHRKRAWCWSASRWCLSTVQFSLSPAGISSGGNETVHVQRTYPASLPILALLRVATSMFVLLASFRRCCLALAAATARQPGGSHIMQWLRSIMTIRCANGSGRSEGVPTEHDFNNLHHGFRGAGMSALADGQVCMHAYTAWKVELLAIAFRERDCERHTSPVVSRWLRTRRDCCSELFLQPPSSDCNRTLMFKHSCGGCCHTNRVSMHDDQR